MISSQAIETDHYKLKQLFEAQVERLKNGDEPLPFNALPEKEFFERMAIWSEEAYIRVGLMEDEECELILICWNKGQKTAIHDHDGQKCWVYLIDGHILETIHESDELLKVKSETIHQRGDVSYMDDSKGLHCLENKTEGHAMTLHLYTSPIRRCQVFSEKNQCFELKKLSNHTSL